MGSFVSVTDCDFINKHVTMIAFEVSKQSLLVLSTLQPFMFYKSSLLALTFFSLFVSSVMAADLSTTDSVIDQQQLELTTDTSLETTQQAVNSTFHHSTEQHNIASATSELNEIDQWEINKSVTLNDIVLTPAPISTIAQAPERLPDTPLPSAVIETAKPAIIKSTTSNVETQQPITITEPPTPVMNSGANESINKPTNSVIATPKPQNSEQKNGQ